MSEMKVVCAHRKKVIKDGPEDKLISHGICRECEVKWRKELEEYKQNKPLP